MVLPNTNLGFLSHVDLLHHLFVYYDGKETLHVCFVDGVNPRKVFRTSFTDSSLSNSSFSGGVHRGGRPNRGMFDNLRVYQVPRRKAEADKPFSPNHNQSAREESL